MRRHHECEKSSANLRDTRDGVKNPKRAPTDKNTNQCACPDRIHEHTEERENTHTHTHKRTNSRSHKDAMMDKIWANNGNLLKRSASF